MFAGTELARRIERAECGLLEDCTAEIARRAGPERAFTRVCAGGVVAFSGADSPMTKLAGLGFAGVPTEEELERVETEFGARGAAVQVELCNLAETGIAERLSRRGYALVGFENVLGRRLGGLGAARERTGIAVARCNDAELDAWVAAVVSAFETPDQQGVAAHESYPRRTLESLVRLMAGTHGHARYLARRAGKTAGGASMRITEGIAQLCGAGTLPDHRRKGVQAALLAFRLVEAARAGCDVAVVTTLPGSKSQENVQKQGFELLYTRAILRR